MKPSRMRLILLAAVLSVGALSIGAAALMSWDSGGVVIGGPFSLRNGDGKIVTDEDFRGKFMLVYFGYTFCPDVCPTTLTHVADAMDRLGDEASKINPIFITIDPRRDTPAMMKQYTSAFSPRLIGLTGTPVQIAAVAKEYHVYYAEHRTGSGSDDYSMDHSSVLYLMGPDGTLVTLFRSEDTGEKLAASISKFMRQGVSVSGSYDRSYHDVAR